MILRLDNLIHSYTVAGQPTHLLLSIPDWQIASGQQVLLRGVSGSGKTTLFNIMAGLMRPTQGTVWLDDQSLYALPEAARDRFRAQRIGYVFQNHYLVGSLTALQNVVMPMMYAGQIPAAQRRTRAIELLAQVGLADRAQHRPSQLSTGQRLRVAIARALANRPALVLADEPTASLDPESAAQVMDLLQSSCQETEATLLVASHDPALEDRFEQVFDLRGAQLLNREREPYAV